MYPAEADRSVTGASGLNSSRGTGSVVIFPPTCRRQGKTVLKNEAKKKQHGSLSVQLAHWGRRCLC